MSLIVCRSIVDRRVSKPAWTFVSASARTFADEAGIHRTYVSDIERGARNPTITIVARLAAPLGVTAADLLLDERPNDC